MELALEFPKTGARGGQPNVEARANSCASCNNSQPQGLLEYRQPSDCLSACPSACLAPLKKPPDQAGLLEFKEKCALEFASSPRFVLWCRPLPVHKSARSCRYLTVQRDEGKPSAR